MSNVSVAYSSDNTLDTDDFHSSRSRGSQDDDDWSASMRNFDHFKGADPQSKAFIGVLRQRADSSATSTCAAQIHAMLCQCPSEADQSKDAKRQRRLIRNRISAHLHREKKRLYLESLEEELLKALSTIREMQSQGTTTHHTVMTAGSSGRKKRVVGGN